MQALQFMTSESLILYETTYLVEWRVISPYYGHSTHS
jgi:hypothetical protein